MNILIVGLGSMGKRRIRNLRALGVQEVWGCDARADRRREAEEKYGIRTFADQEEAYRGKPDAVVISLPPDLHTPFAMRAVQAGASFFTEASVVSEGMPELIAATRARGVVGFPSCTMRYFPGPRRVRQLLQERTIGKVWMWWYHSGQYLPDWHPWEAIQDFYVSKRLTGGCREIVPFELVWLVDVFGEITRVSAQVGKVSDLPVDIDDLYQMHVAHAGGTRGTLAVDVLARPAVRHLRVLGSEGTVEWDAPSKRIRWQRAPGGVWQEEDLGKGTVEQGYLNPEEPYIEEMRAFVECVQQRTKPSHSLEDDLQILRLLEGAETSSRSGKAYDVRPL